MQAPRWDILQGQPLWVQAGKVEDENEVWAKIRRHRLSAHAHLIKKATVEHCGEIHFIPVVKNKDEADGRYHGLWALSNCFLSFYLPKKSSLSKSLSKTSMSSSWPGIDVTIT